MMDRIERIHQSFTTRKTDPTDTHDYIHRHDPDFQKRKERRRLLYLFKVRAYKILAQQRSLGILLATEN